jgi:DNA-binding HxlR family transcriptional regulator
MTATMAVKTMTVNTEDGMMRGNAFDPQCPTRVVLDRIGDKWTVLVVSALSKGTMRFTELRTRVGGVAPKVLTQTLRALERDGILARKVYAQVPPRVEYTLTPLGRSLAEPIGVIQDWAEEHVSGVLQAREDYDATLA